MTLIVETGAIVTNANSYITTTEYDTWTAARFGSTRTTAPATTAAKEQLILRAMDYFEAQEFQGVLVLSTQPLQWPRAWVSIDGFEVSQTSIPQEVKNSIYELAYAEETSNSQLAAVGRKTSREKLGDLEVEYAESSSSVKTVRAIPNAMRKLLAYGGYSNRVIRI